MTVYPLFLKVRFEPNFPSYNPSTPVEGVDLAYMSDDGIKITQYQSGPDGDDREMWENVAEYIRGFCEHVANVRIVGWNLRNLDWPAVVANVVKHGLKLPKWLLLPLDEKWNKAPLVDLMNIFVQGGFIESEKWPPFSSVCACMLNESLLRLQDRPVVETIARIYGLYERAMM